jgi:hypothetical protein
MTESRTIRAGSLLAVFTVLYWGAAVTFATVTGSAGGIVGAAIASVVFVILLAALPVGDPK